MKNLLLFLLVVTMGAGARTMFEIAYQAMAVEHAAAPDPKTYFYIALALWFVTMMVADVLLLTNKEVKYRNQLVVMLTVGVLGPVIYMLFNSK